MPTLIEELFISQTTDNSQIRDTIPGLISDMNKLEVYNYDGTEVVVGLTLKNSEPYSDMRKSDFGLFLL